MRGIGGGRGRGKEVSLCHRDSTGVGCSPAWMSSHKEGILLPHRASLQRKGFSSPQAPKYHPAGSVPHPVWALCRKEGVPLPRETSPIRERSQCFTKHHPTGMRSSPACREGVPSPHQVSSHRRGVPLPQETTPGRDGCLCLTENCPQEASPIRKGVPNSDPQGQDPHLPAEDGSCHPIRHHPIRKGSRCSTKHHLTGVGTLVFLNIPP